MVWSPCCQGSLKSLLQHHILKASIIWHSAFFMVQLSHPWVSRVARLVNNLPANIGDPSLIPGAGRSPGDGTGYPLQYSWTSLVIQTVKESSCNVGDLGSTPGLGRFPGGRHGNPLQYSCLGISMDRGTWWATVHRVSMSQTRLSD